MINSTDLRKHALSTVAFGYSKKQTDTVLDLAADTIDRMAAEIIHLNQDKTSPHEEKQFRLYWSPQSGLWIKHSDHTHHLTDSSGNVLEDAAFRNEPGENMDNEAEEVQLPCEY